MIMTAGAGRRAAIYRAKLDPDGLQDADSVDADDGSESLEPQTLAPTTMASVPHGLVPTARPTKSPARQTQKIDFNMYERRRTPSADVDDKISSDDDDDGGGVVIEYDPPLRNHTIQTKLMQRERDHNHKQQMRLAKIDRVRRN